MSRPCSFAWRTTAGDHRCTLAPHGLFGRHEEHVNGALVAWYDETEKAGGYGPCPLEGCNRLMPHEHGASSFTAAGQTLSEAQARTLFGDQVVDAVTDPNPAPVVGNAWSRKEDAPPGAVALKIPAADPTFTTFEATSPFTVTDIFTLDEILKIAEAVKSGKTTSYVEAAKVLADFILESRRFPFRTDSEVLKILHLASPWPEGDESGPVVPSPEVVVDMAREILFRREQVVEAHRLHECPGIDVCTWPKVKL